MKTKITLLVLLVFSAFNLCAQNEIKEFIKPLIKQLKIPKKLIEKNEEGIICFKFSDDNGSFEVLYESNLVLIEQLKLDIKNTVWYKNIVFPKDTTFLIHYTYEDIDTQTNNMYKDFFNTIFRKEIINLLPITVIYSNGISCTR